MAKILSIIITITFIVGSVDYTTQIQPIFNSNCGGCHLSNSAGGLNSFANRKSIILIEPNGMVKPNKWYTRPTVNDGSTIFIGKKEITEPFDLTQFVTNWTQIISSLITAVILSQQIGSS